MDKIVFAKVKDNAQIPARDSWNAGFDIYPCFEEESFIIEPHTTALVPTGIASAVPENYYIQIQERGSTGSKGIKYSAGVIDSSYRGEWFLATTNTNNKPILITKMDISSLPENVKELIEKAYIVYPYTKALLNAIPIASLKYRKKLEIIKGEVTSPINPKPGCRFADRCPYATDRCREDGLKLKEITPGHFVACRLHE